MSGWSWNALARRCGGLCFFLGNFREERGWPCRVAGIRLVCTHAASCLEVSAPRLVRIFPSRVHRQLQLDSLEAQSTPPPHLPLPPPPENQKRLGGRLENAREVNEAFKTYTASQRWMQHRLWRALCARQWPLFERILTNYWRCGLQYDEVVYTLKLHGYMLSHRQKKERAVLVLEEMKAARVHPAIIRLNEGIVLSQFDLRDIFCALPPNAFQNLCRLAFHSAIKLQRQRRVRLRERLLRLPSAELFSLTHEKVRAMLDSQERELCFPDETLALIDGASLVEAGRVAAAIEALPVSPEALGAPDSEAALSLDAFGIVEENFESPSPPRPLQLPPNLQSLETSLDWEIHDETQEEPEDGLWRGVVADEEECLR